MARQYGVHSIPHLKLFDPGGRLVAEGNGWQVLAGLESNLGPGSGIAGGGSTALSGDRGDSTSPELFLGVVTLVFLTAFALVFRKRRLEPAPELALAQPAPRIPPLGDPAGAPSDGWFVMIQGSLDGPYQPQALARLVGAGHLPPDAPARRRGDSEWHRVNEIIRAR